MTRYILENTKTGAFVVYATEAQAKRGCAYGLGGLHDFADGKHLTPTSNLCHDTEARRPVDLMTHRTAISPRLLPRINPGSEEKAK